MIGSLLSFGEGEVILLGFLDIDCDSLTLEDLSGTVPLDVADARAANGIFAIGSIVMVQGDSRDGRVFAALVGHPPATVWRSVVRTFGRRRPTHPAGT
jgi:hypothetical protein